MTDMKNAHPVVFGEVLFDRFPDGHVVLGGAPFNVAWHLQAFGRAPVMISRVGNDALGRNIRQAMEDWSMALRGLQLDSQHPTGTLDVSLHAGEPAYDIVDQRAYDFIDAALLPPLPESGVLYHGSLALRNPVSRHALETLRQDTDLELFVDVNLRAPWWQRDAVLSMLQQARWAKLNADELACLCPEEDNLEARAHHLLADYELEWLVVTLGAAGARAFMAAADTLGIAPVQSIPVADTVGAGDAFASVLLLGLLRGWPMQQTLQRAQAFASAIVGVRGATVSDTGFYQRICADWELLCG
jgi:fructokinase